MSITRQSTAGMSREMWVNSRINSIGGSDAAAILGLNPYMSPYALWLEKTRAVIPEDIDSKEAVRLGRYLEQYIAERFSEETGKRVRRENAIIRNTAFPFAHANVDRMVIGEKSGLECKSTSALNLKRFKNGMYPDRYYVQCVHYMAVTGAERWYLAVLIGNSDFRVYTIERDQAEIDALMQSEAAFWQLVEKNTPPMADGLPATTEALSQMNPVDPEAPPVDMSPVEASIREYLALKEQLDQLKLLVDRAANEIKNHMGQSQYGASGAYSVSWKRFPKSRFNKAAFIQDHPEIDLDKYNTVSTGSRFEVKEIV